MSTPSRPQAWNGSGGCSGCVRAFPWLDHVHLKDGLLWRTVRKKDGAAERFWRAACAAFQWTECQNAIECGDDEEDKGDPCRCIVIAPVDQRAAALTLTWLKRQRVDHVARLWGFMPSSPDPAPAPFIELASWIVSWGFAPPAARAGT